MTRATSVIDDCINKLKIRCKHKKNHCQNEKKKRHDGKQIRPKKWSGARRPAGPATTALLWSCPLAITSIGRVGLCFFEVLCPGAKDCESLYL